MSPDDALIICRILQDVSSVLLWGTYAYLSTLVPFILAETIDQRLRAFRLVAIAIAASATFAVLPLEASALGGGWGDAGDITTIKDIVFDTNIGNAWLVQAIAVIALAMTSWLVPRQQQAATALCAGLLLGCRALMGHSIMGEGAAGDLLQLSYLVHVLSSGAWLGALVPLLLVFRQLSKQNHKQEAAAVGLQRFSTAGQVMVAFAVCTGVINTGLILGRLPTAWSQPYQLLLAAKICLVGAMIVIALINRIVIVPRTKSGLLPGERLLLCTTTVELVLGGGALALVNIFSTLDPVWD
jgi:putative copper resistance protein D